MKNLLWHTDIVVNGQGMGLKLKPGRKGCFDLSVIPDVWSRKTSKALTRFKKALKALPPACSVNQAKAKVEKAVKKTKARWNKWHRQAY